MDFGQMLVDQVFGALWFAIRFILSIFGALFEAMANVPPEPPEDERYESEETPEDECYDSEEDWV